MACSLKKRLFPFGESAHQRSVFYTLRTRPNDTKLRTLYGLCPSGSCRYASFLQAHGTVTQQLEKKTAFTLFSFGLWSEHSSARKKKSTKTKVEKTKPRQLIMIA